MGRVRAEAAPGAVKAKGSHFQAVFRRKMPRLEYNGAIWAVAHRRCRLVWKILPEGVRYVEPGAYRDPKARKRRAQSLARALRKLGYHVEITPAEPATAPA